MFVKVCVKRQLLTEEGILGEPRRDCRGRTRKRDRRRHGRVEVVHYTENAAALIIFPQKWRFQRNYRVKFPMRLARERNRQDRCQRSHLAKNSQGWKGKYVSGPKYWVAGKAKAGPAPSVLCVEGTTTLPYRSLS